MGSVKAQSSLVSLSESSKSDTENAAGYARGRFPRLGGAKSKDMALAYTGVMLLEAWTIKCGQGTTDPWPHHPMHPANNINGITDDPVVENGRPVGVFSLGDAAIERDPTSVLSDISAAYAGDPAATDAINGDD